MKAYKILVAIVIIISQYATDLFGGEDWERILNLKGYWKFSIGDDKKWAMPGYNDSDWEDVFVPSTWEDEGFHGYDGYAWYRRKFDTPDNLGSEVIYLNLGYVDDVDEVYINGNLIGYSGKFPPDYETAYFSFRKYPLPVKYLKPNGKNVIAVRVYDSEMGGGIVNGDIGLYTRPYSMTPDLSLEGEWKFKTGDNKAWKDKNFNDKDWKKMIVPSFWEAQGFNGYDGYAWYRLTFDVPARFKDKKIVLLLGRIDDFDEVYLNGKLVGSTGRIERHTGKFYQSGEYQQFRGYYLSEDDLLLNQENTIAVRVYDGFQDGGIYQGPIGLITQEKYTKFWREKKKQNKNIFEFMFE